MILSLVGDRKEIQSFLNPCGPVLCVGGLGYYTRYPKTLDHGFSREYVLIHAAGHSHADDLVGIQVSG